MTIQSKILALVAVLGVVGLTACENRTDRQAQTDTTRTEQTTTNENQEQSRVVDTDTSQLNQQGEEKGKAEVGVKKEVTRTITSERNIPTVVEGEKKADINRMSVEDFTALGFSKDIAESVVKYRDDHNGFKSIDDLKNVPGVNESMLAPLRGKLGVSQEK